MCELASRCKNRSEYRVIHKAVGARPAFIREACSSCAARIGARAPHGPIINMQNMENHSYKIEVLI